MPDRKFFKGVNDHYLSDSTQDTERAKLSIYYLWWQFARIHPVLWYARTYDMQPVDQRTEKLLAKFGDLSDPLFEVWWYRTGLSLFAEPEAMQAVQLVEPGTRSALVHPEARVLDLKVALITDKQTILNEFRQVIDTHHPGRSLSVTKFSNASQPLHTIDFDDSNIRTAWLCWLYKHLYPSVHLWVIGDRLGLLPNAKVRDAYGLIPLERTTAKAARNSLRVTVDRAKGNASALFQHVVYGDFPKYERIDEVKYPFGQKHGKDFNTATNVKNGPWQQWLVNEYKSRLMAEVRAKAAAIAPPGYPKTTEAADHFLAGNSNVW
jgi:hypothetical protein